METGRFNARKLVFSAVAIALSAVCALVVLFRLPFGGSVTLMSMFFIALIGYWYGPVWGIMSGFVFGIINFMEDPIFLNLIQACCDYFFAFAALGLSGFFSKKKHGLAIGYIVGICGRGIFQSIGGYAFWMEYMPEDFPQTFAFAYPVIYNFSVIIAEGILTIIIINIPPVKKAIDHIGKIATAS